MKAADVMVSNVITVSPEATVQDVANILMTNRISAVPVVTASGDLVGIISEGDLIRRVETDTDRRRSWWMELLLGRGPLAAEYVKSHSHKVSHLMSRDVITATPDTPLRDIAGLLEKNGIKRVPIVDNGKLVGIVSRANLVQALAAQKNPVAAQPPGDDLAIREAVMVRLDGKFWTKFAPVNVIVRDGIVDIWGISIPIPCGRPSAWRSRRPRGFAASTIISAYSALRPTFRRSAMKASDIMVANVISVPPNASVREVARVLLSNQISAMPVLDELGRLIGIVSEGDLMRRAELDTEHRRSWWLRIFSNKDKEALAVEFMKSHSQNVQDVMTRDVITAAPDTPLREIAAVLEKKHIKRVPIVDEEGKVLGIVSRANLIQALATLREDNEQAGTDDATIRRKVLAQFRSEEWSRYSTLNAMVQGGTVELWGFVGSEAEKEAARVTAELVPGVRAIENNVIVRPIAAGF